MADYARPLVSVVIPTYQRAHYLGGAIDSALQQADADVEVIVVDDGSTDETADVARSYGDRIVFVQQANRREGAARNAGVSRARGSLVAFLDSDDLWLPGKLARDIGAFQMQPRAGLLFSRAVFIDPSGRELRRSRPAPPITAGPAGLVRENYIPLSTVVVPIDVLREVGGFSELPEMSGSYDWHLWVRIAARHPLRFVPAEGALMRSHPDNMMTDPRRMERSITTAAAGYLQDPVVRDALRTANTRADAWVDLQVALVWAFAGARTPALRHLARGTGRDPGILRDGRAWKALIRALAGRRAWGSVAALWHRFIALRVRDR